MRILSRPLIAICALLLGCCASSDAAVVFLSEQGFESGASPSNPELVKTNTDAPFDLHIYFVPDLGDPRYLEISLGVSSSTPGVASITAFTVLNPVILVGVAPVAVRWDGVGGSLDSPQLISAMTGFADTSAGLNNAYDGSGAFRDAGYDSTAGAFYFGQITLDPTAGGGTTELNLLVGSDGVEREGISPTGLVFGFPESTLVLGDDIGATGTTYDARITVVPEPSAFAFLGLVGAVACGFKKLKDWRLSQH